MKKSLLLIALMLLVAVPAMAARVSAVPVTHGDPILVLQAYQGDSDGNNVSFKGYAGPGDEVIDAVPGVLSIVPGDNWANFVGAAQEVPAVPYTIKNVVLCKQTPPNIQCVEDAQGSPIFPAKLICQQGTLDIRLWWPLMYEAPGTVWTLTILYGTGGPYADGGVNPITGAPNPAGYVHTEVWQWKVDATLDSLEDLLQLFHELPFGLDEVPLISDEVLFPILDDKIDAIEEAVEGTEPDLVTAGLILGEFEMEVMDACIGSSPINPDPTGPGTGIANTLENPACCKLMVDAEYIGFELGVFVPKK